MARRSALSPPTLVCGGIGGKGGGGVEEGEGGRGVEEGGGAEWGGGRVEEECSYIQRKSATWKITLLKSIQRVGGGF